MVQVYKRGTYAAVICSEAFAEFAKMQRKVFGTPDLPLIIIPHPLGGLSMDEVQQRAELAIPQIIDLIKKRVT
jgi:hypothetical protein